MSFDPIADLQELKDELVNDPLNLYQGDGVNHDFAAADADAINAVSSAYTVNNASIEIADVKAMTTRAIFSGLTAPEGAWFAWITDGDVIRVDDDTLLELAGVGGTSFWQAADRPTMDPRMISLMQRDGSRAEVLWGRGSIVRGSDISNAINLP